MSRLSHTGAAFLATILFVGGAFLGRFGNDILARPGRHETVFRVMITNILSGATGLAIYAGLETTPTALAIHIIGWWGMYMSSFMFFMRLSLQLEAEDAWDWWILRPAAVFYAFSIPMLATAFTFQ